VRANVLIVFYILKIFPEIICSCSAGKIILFAFQFFYCTRFSDKTLPAVNVKETDDNYIIEVAAPGMEKKDFKINLQNNVLTISSEKEEKKSKKKGDYTRREFNYESFQRCFTVRESEVDSDKIKADYADGVLSIKLPKKEEIKPKPAREIKIG